MNDDSIPSDKQSGQTALAADAPTIILSKPAPDVNAATIIMGRTPAPPIKISTERIGEFINRYQLIEELGVGGFGIVWRAEQFEPIHRVVALKVIKPGMDSREIIARFEAERQALALMDHPNIAGVLDAGATDNGRPYFVMELVKGVPITDYCDERKLTIRQRLELFIPVCQAVQHAHQKAILHRDLKPGNILVAEVDGKPVPKVIDFGIAKALGTSPDDAFDATLARTQEGMLVGTPQYMSTEQAGMGTDMDTRTGTPGAATMRTGGSAGCCDASGWPWTGRRRSAGSNLRRTHRAVRTLLRGEARSTSVEVRTSAATCVTTVRLRRSDTRTAFLASAVTRL